MPYNVKQALQFNFADIEENISMQTAGRFGVIVTDGCNQLSLHELIGLACCFM